MFVMKNFILYKSCATLSCNDLIVFENYFQTKFPLSFKKFYLRNNGGFTVMKDFFIGCDRHDIHCFLSIKYSSDTIKTIIEEYEGNVRLKNFQTKFVPFALDQGGNYYLIDISPENYGKIYMWFHDIDYDDPLIFITDNFKSLIKHIMENKKTIGQKLFDVLDYIDQYDKKKNPGNNICFVDNLIEKWNELDNAKWNERNSKIVIVRIINEMIRLHKEGEAEKWFSVLNEISPKSPNYAINFLRGEMYYKLHRFDQAYHYLKISYDENKSFVSRQNMEYIDFLMSYEKPD